MADPRDLFSLILFGVMLTLTALGLVISAIMPKIERWNRNYFMSFFAINILLVVAGLVDLFSWEVPKMEMASKISIYFEFLFLSLTMPMFTAYLLRSCGENWQRNRIFRSAFVIWIIFFILLGIAQFTTFIYYFTPENKCYRGSCFFLLMMPVIILMLLNLKGVIRRRSNLSKQYYVAFLIYLIPLTITLFADSFFVVSELVFVGETFSGFSMFGIIIYDQIDRHISQQREIAHQRVNIMVLQMRPHFIYNAMMSIYYLCVQNPKKAQQVTLDFTTYLRKNFTAIVSEDTIPFSDELEHTRAYLAIEQVQFEDNLFVDYDISYENFRVPPLTLQPIVENAVKHGMDPEYAPLCIKIRTCKTNSGNEIVVEDNGSGFSPVEDYKPYTALANIQQRLKMMCGGKLTIKSREGGGTMVILTIPES